MVFSHIPLPLFSPALPVDVSPSASSVFPEINSERVLLVADNFLIIFVNFSYLSILVSCTCSYQIIFIDAFVHKPLIAAWKMHIQRQTKPYNSSHDIFPHLLFIKTRKLGFNAYPVHLTNAPALLLLVQSVLIFHPLFCCIYIQALLLISTFILFHLTMHKK